MSSAAENPAANSRAPLTVLLCVVVAELIGFGIVMPLLPFWAREFDATGLQLGFIQGAYALAQFAGAPLWGRLSDRIGRRPVMLFAIAGTACSLLALGFAESIFGLLIARFCAGAFAANVSVAGAYIADCTAPRERTRWMGMLGAAFAVGFTLGPPLGGMASLYSPAAYSPAAPMFLAAGISALNFVAALLLLKEPQRRGDNSLQEDSGGLLTVLRNKTVLRLCVAYFLFSLAVTQLENMFQYFMADSFNWNAFEVAWVLFVMALVMGGVQGGAMKRLSARWPERTLVLGGCTLMAAGFALLPAAGIGAGGAAGVSNLSVIIWLALPLLLLAVGRGVSQPALMGLASFQAEAGARGAVMGAFQSAASLARIGGPVLAGALYDSARALPFILGALLLIAVLGVARKLPAGCAT